MLSFFCAFFLSLFLSSTALFFLPLIISVAYEPNQSEHARPFVSGLLLSILYCFHLVLIAILLSTDPSVFFSL